MGNMDRKNYTKKLIQYSVYQSHVDAVQHEIDANERAKKLIANSYESDRRADI